MILPELNQLPVNQLKAALVTCCGSTAWVNEMAKTFPVESKESLFEQAEISWFSLNESDWREAFDHHPKIGDINSLREKFANTSTWASGEQSGVSTASQQVLEDLSEGNRLYETKFGYIFIVCATGKSADEMLEILNSRLPNSPEDEILIAMQEQNKITKIRLEKLLVS
ncbi:2-oxo-4-hydroxy-4-carboxy-5-ureidoimidazoline decarboxylase [Spirosoma endbachense]|uniref:2-oxo-4-hydroxy-4-carboxy-5-ureidoimidazoline decarboxylase n=1 Tax=Spirosoma endbachense TaxID=2666025 RepID=A0A6P1VM90_9BACT|nr:2-oxo-4-hydroxy-4-carboxy-5-ureidoimidazoline decarboxylase [Spirosoma endbachense]QHV94193.1 2-oxo-4-hydroxy-4-carboxy-5-ureidoimidazoline decarboxylase [Spirosoma endbachense]